MKGWGGSTENDGRVGILLNGILFGWTFFWFNGDIVCKQLNTQMNIYIYVRIGICSLVDVEGGKGKWRGLFGLHCAIDEDGSC